VKPVNRPPGKPLQSEPKAFSERALVRIRKRVYPTRFPPFAASVGGAALVLLLLIPHLARGPRRPNWPRKSLLRSSFNPCCRFVLP
jgi:hypothetical protein